MTGTEPTREDAAPDLEYVNDHGLETGAYWGGRGPVWERQAEQAGVSGFEADYDVPWWDGERLASDRERTPGLVAELEADEQEAGA